MDGRASYCVYATNNRSSTIWFPLKLLQCRYIFILRVMCIEHVIYARRVYILLRRVDRTTRIQLHTVLHVYYIYCTVLKYTNSNKYIKGFIKRIINILLKYTKTILYTK